jgi:hypothetical protein
VTFDQWEAVFDRAREHLNERGIFVFDINTEHRLATPIGQPTRDAWFGDGNLVVMDVTDGGNGRTVALGPVRADIGGEAGVPAGGCTWVAGVRLEHEKEREGVSDVELRQLLRGCSGEKRVARVGRPAEAPVGPGRSRTQFARLFW